MSLTLIFGFFLSPSPLIFGLLSLMCDIIYILTQYTQLRATSFYDQRMDGVGSLHLVSCTVCRCAPSPFDSFCFDCLRTCLVPDPSLECKPFLEESPKKVQRRIRNDNHLETMRCV